MLLLAPYGRSAAIIYSAHSHVRIIIKLSAHVSTSHNICACFFLKNFEILGRFYFKLRNKKMYIYNTQNVSRKCGW